MELPIGFVFIALFVMFGWIAFVQADGRRRRERLRLMTEFQGKLLDKLGSAQDLGAFLDSRGGTRFLDALTADHGGVHERVLRAVQTGVVLTCLGFGLLGLARAFAASEAQGFFIATGVIVLALGLGFLLSSWIAVRLTRALAA